MQPYYNFQLLFIAFLVTKILMLYFSTGLFKKEGRDIYHTARVSWVSGHYNQIQVSSIHLRDFHKLSGSKLTIWSQGPCLDSSICAWFYGLQSLFITHIKRDLKGSSSKARSGCSQEGIYYSAIEEVIQKQSFLCHSEGPVDV